MSQGAALGILFLGLVAWIVSQNSDAFKKVDSTIKSNQPAHHADRPADGNDLAKLLSFNWTGQGKYEVQEVDGRYIAIRNNDPDDIVVDGDKSTMLLKKGDYCLVRPRMTSTTTGTVNVLQGTSCRILLVDFQPSDPEQWVKWKE